MADDKRYYWLKLKRDFFSRHDIRIVEAMPNGKDYVLFYLKLLCESVDHDGNLRFSDHIPYSAEMLSTITNTNPDIVRSAIKIFTDLQMMEILDDGTIFMNEVTRLIGSTAGNDNAERQRRYREKRKLEAQQSLREESENSGEIAQELPENNTEITNALSERYDSVTKNNESKSKSKRKSKNNIYMINGVDRTSENDIADDTQNDIAIQEEAEGQEEDAVLDVPSRPRDDDSLSEEFETLWEEYPRKQGKKKALKDYLKARKTGTTQEEVLDGIRRYNEYIQRTNTPSQYIKQGSTWFFQNCWNDDYGQETGNKTEGTQEPRKGNYFVQSTQPYYDYDTYERLAVAVDDTVPEAGSIWDDF